MDLRTEIGDLRDRSLADLDSVYEYYGDTKAAWDIVRGMVVYGQALAVRNTATGMTSTGTELLDRARGYVTKQLTEATFQQFVSVFEVFYFDLLRAWLTAHPQSLGGRKVDFKSVLEAPDIDAVVRLVVGREVNEVLYERPSGWFAYLDEKVKLGCPSPDEVERIAEAKATRDVLVHNRGVVNRTYLAKAGTLARFPDASPVDVPEDYHRATFALLRKVVSDLANAALAKAR